LGEHAAPALVQWRRSKGNRFFEKNPGSSYLLVFSTQVNAKWNRDSRFFEVQGSTHLIVPIYYCPIYYISGMKNEAQKLTNK
jgi:hypothetical protein